jgi:hypothetical protein
MLGLRPDDIYSHVHAMTAGAAAAEPGQPVTVMSAMPSTGFPIPSRPVGSEAVQLDMAAVTAKLSPTRNRRLPLRR